MTPEQVERIHADKTTPLRKLAAELGVSSMAVHRVRCGQSYTETAKKPKLTAQQVLEIVASNERISVLAARYGVARSTIYDAHAGRTWRDLEVARPKRVPIRVVPGRSGEANNRARLTVAIVLQIARSTEPTKALARRFGVCPGAVRKIRDGRTWAKVTGITPAARPFAQPAP